MAFKGIPYCPPVAWAVPPSPARDICSVFRASVDQGADHAATGWKGYKWLQKNCAKLCAIVQTFSKKIPPKRDFSSHMLFKQFSFDTQTLKLHSQNPHLMQKLKCHH